MIFEVTDNCIHLGQIFAEMLGTVCHPEFFDHTDLEAFVIYIQYTTFQLYHYHFPRAYLHEFYHQGEPCADSEGVVLQKK